MKAAISSVLREQTGLDEKSLRKQVKKNLKASTDESALDFKTEFSQTIESLISKGKVISVDGCLQLAEGKTKKRKLKDDEIDSGESTKSKSAKTEGFQHAESKPLNKSVAAVHSGADDPLKSLWKTGTSAPAFTISEIRILFVKYRRATMEGQRIRSWISSHQPWLHYTLILWKFEERHNRRTITRLHWRNHTHKVDHR